MSKPEERAVVMCVEEEEAKERKSALTSFILADKMRARDKREEEY